jgi:hypothetical protein
MDASNHNDRTEVTRWLEDWNAALIRSESRRLTSLLEPDCHWRDVLGLRWEIFTRTGAEIVAASLVEASETSKPRGWRLQDGDLSIQHRASFGSDTVDAQVTFETSVGPCEAVFRFKRTGQPDRPLLAWTILTALAEVRGHEEKYKLKTRDQVFRSFKDQSWLEKREASTEFADRDPAVLVIGAGQAGLSLAARLGQLNIDTLVVDENDRVGDNWRKRYKALVLHNRTRANHLPYLPFPKVWPDFLPKDMFAEWLEHYSKAMELNVWTKTRFVSGHFDEASGRWSVKLARDGREQILNPRHVVMATGVSAIPDRSPVAGIDRFSGTVLHSADYAGPENWAGKRVIVFGTGTSGHDIAQDLCEHGAVVTIVQRSPTMVQNVVPTAQLPYALYSEPGLTTEYCDLVSLSTPLQLMKDSGRLGNSYAADMDSELHRGLEKAGFRINKGEDGLGWQLLYLTRGGGFYFNVGCSNLIVDGKIRVVQAKNVEGFSEDGLRMKDGITVGADLMVLAKGYLGQSAMVDHLFGREIADRVGEIWDFDDDSQELRNMWRPTPQKGLWFHAGSLANCRVYSKYLALQIQGQELGLFS